MTPTDGRYLIEVGSSARSLQRLPAKAAAAIVELITGPLAENPHQLSKPLFNELAGYRTARRGDYRVLIRIDEAAHTVLIAYIDHRADAYRRRR